METIRETITINTRFPLGQVCTTHGVCDRIPIDEQVAALRRHALLDWGDVCSEDWDENDRSFRDGRRLLSVFHAKSSTTFWIITEADRTVTTLLLPDEY